MMLTLRKLVRFSVLATPLLAVGVGACSETWKGVKEDTKENVHTTGQGVEKAGENIKKQTE